MAFWIALTLLLAGAVKRKQFCDAVFFYKVPLVINGAMMTEHNENHDRSRRISVSAARKMLGMIGRNYSDEDMMEILDCLYGFAEEVFDVYQCGGHGDDTIDPDAGRSANEA